MSNTMNKTIKGASFLVEDQTAEDIFTPEDFSDEHVMMGKTTEDFVLKEVVPKLEKLENHEFDISRKLLEKAGDIGLLGADVPEEYGGLGLDKISSSVITEKFSRAGGFSVSYGAHVGIGSFQSYFSAMKIKRKNIFLV